MQLVLEVTVEGRVLVGPVSRSTGRTECVDLAPLNRYSGSTGPEPLTLEKVKFWFLNALTVSLCTWKSTQVLPLSSILEPPTRAVEGGGCLRRASCPQKSCRNPNVRYFIHGFRLRTERVGSTSDRGAPVDR